MNKTRKTSNAVRILHRRYVGEDARRKASLEKERVNAEVARTIYELREQAGLSQKELAERVETTQSVISRLEDADYDGHSLSMLSRIAKALNQQVQVVMRPKEQSERRSNMDTGVIVRDPEILGGIPCFRGTRVPFQNLLDYLEAGDTLDQFLAQFPTVTRKMVIEALETAKDSLLTRIG